MISFEQRNLLKADDYSKKTAYSYNLKDKLLNVNKQLNFLEFIDFIGICLGLEVNPL